MRRLSPSTIAHLLLLGVVLVWGATFVLIKDALQDASPLLFNLLRMSLATIALAVVHRKKLSGITRPSLWAGATVGIFLAAGYQFQTLGLARTTAVKSAFITGLVVVFVPLLTMIPGLRPASSPAPAAASIAGALLAFGGLVLLTTPPATAWSHIVGSIGSGDILTLLCAVAFAGHLIALAHTSTKVAIPQLATLQIGFSALIMALTLPLAGPIYVNVTTRLVTALLVTSLLATAAAFTIQSWAQQHLPPTHTALLLTLEPVFAWVTSFLFLGERLNSRSLIGALLILTGILFTEFIPNPRPISEHPSDHVG